MKKLIICLLAGVSIALGQTAVAVKYRTDTNRRTEPTVLKTPTGFTNTIESGATLNGAGTFDFSLGTFTLADAQIGWTKISKSGASLADLPTRLFSDLQSKPTTAVGYGITNGANIDALGAAGYVGTGTVVRAAIGTSGQVLASNGTSYVATTLAPATTVQGTAGQILANGTSGSAQSGNVPLTLPDPLTPPGNVTIAATKKITLGATALASLSVNGDLATNNLVVAPPSSGSIQIPSGSTTTPSIVTSTGGAGLFFASGQYLSQASGSNVTWQGTSIGMGGGEFIPFSTGGAANEGGGTLGRPNIGWGKIYNTVKAVGTATTAVEGTVIANTTATTGGSTGAQYSPALQFTGHAWNTTSVAADNIMDATMQLRTTSNVGSPTPSLAFAFRKSTAGAGAFTDSLTLSSDLSAAVTIATPLAGLYLSGVTSLQLVQGSNAIRWESNSFFPSAINADLGYGSVGETYNFRHYTAQNVGQFRWGGGSGVPDTGLARTAAATVKVTDGSTGTGNLTAATVTATTIVTPGGQSWNGSFSGNLIGATWFDGTTWKFGNTATLNWTPSSPAGATPDVGLARASAGVLKVTDGSSGGGNIAFGGNSAEIYRSTSALTGYTLLRDNNNIGYAGLKLVTGGSGTNKTFELTPYSQFGAWTFRGLAIDNAESQGYHETVNLPFILGATTYQSTSRPAWGTSGSRFRVTAATNTDSSTLASGTAATAVANSFGIPTFAAANTGVTTTNAATVYIDGAPAAGTNMALTNPYALWVAAGRSRFDNDIRVGLSSDTDTKAIDFYNTASGVSRYRIEQSNGALLFKDYQGTNLVQMLTQGQGMTMVGNLNMTATSNLKFGTTISDVLIRKDTNQTLGVVLGDGSGYANMRVNGINYSGTLTGLAGGQILTNSSKTANYTLTTSDQFISFSGSTASQSLTLPAVSGTSGRIYQIKNRASVTVNVVTTAAANEIFTTTATNSITLAVGDSAQFISDGTFWNKL